MSARAIRLVEPGLLTSVQDLGRPGFAHGGVPPSGALDRDALRLANLLLGNAESAAGLEVAWRGPLLLARGDVALVVAGGRFGPAPGRVVELHDGEELDLRRGEGDPACVVAVAGGLDVPVVLGSRSTSLSSGFGGFEGRALKRGDEIPVGEPSKKTPRSSIPEELLPRPPDGVSLRVILGPEAELFTNADLDTFFSAAYRIRPESNRIGLRLSGPVLHPPENRPSEGVLAGSIQIPPEGSPLVLLADRPTTGGYPKIGTVAEVDLGLLGRVAPGKSVGFVRCALEEAVALRREKERRIDEWRIGLAS